MQRRDPGMHQSRVDYSGAKANDFFFSGNAAAANVRPLHISAPVLAALATTAGGVLFGAWVAI